MQKQFQEFPKSLYKGGQEGEHRIVADAEEESAARGEGFVMLGEVEPQPKKSATKAKEK